MPLVVLLIMVGLLLLPVWFLIPCAILTIALAVGSMWSNFNGKSALEAFVLVGGLWTVLGIAKFVLFHVHWIW